MDLESEDFKKDCVQNGLKDDLIKRMTTELLLTHESKKKMDKLQEELVVILKKDLVSLEDKNIFPEINFDENTDIQNLSEWYARKIAAEAEKAKEAKAVEESGPKEGEGMLTEVVEPEPKKTDEEEKKEEDAEPKKKKKVAGLSDDQIKELDSYR